MKTRGHILRSLLILGMLSMFNYSFAQEDNFITPGADKNNNEVNSNPVNTNGLESEYYRESYTNTEPEKRESKTTLHKDEPVESREVAREHGPQTHETTPQQEVKPEDKSAQKKSANLNNSPQEKEEDESVLSFNFLYYMIQKFKFSDVIDQ